MGVCCCTASRSHSHCRSLRSELPFTSYSCATPEPHAICSLRKRRRPVLYGHSEPAIDNDKIESHFRLVIANQSWQPCGPFAYVAPFFCLQHARQASGSTHHIDPILAMHRRLLVLCQPLRLHKAATTLMSSSFPPSNARPSSTARSMKGLSAYGSSAMVRAAFTSSSAT